MLIDVTTYGDGEEKILDTATGEINSKRRPTPTEEFLDEYSRLVAKHGVFFATCDSLQPLLVFTVGCGVLLPEVIDNT